MAQLDHLFRGLDAADMLGKAHLCRKIKELLAVLHLFASVDDSSPPPKSGQGEETGRPQVLL